LTKAIKAVEATVDKREKNYADETSQSYPEERGTNTRNSTLRGGGGLWTTND
jgi:hypothetical protein